MSPYETNLMLMRENNIFNQSYIRCNAERKNEKHENAREQYRGAFCGVEILLPRMKYTHEIVGTHGGALLPESASGACPGSKISRVYRPLSYLNSYCSRNKTITDRE